MVLKTLRNHIRWIMIAITVIFVLSIFGMYGFSGSGRRTQEGGQSDYAVAEIDGKTLMRSTLEQSMRQYAEQVHAQNITSADIPNLYQGALDSIALSSQLDKASKESGLKATDEEIDAAVKQISDQFPTKEAFMQYMDQSGIKMADLRKQMGEQVIRGKLLEGATKDVAVTDQEMKDFYEQTKTLIFHTPAGFRMDFARVKSRAAAETLRSALSGGATWDAAVASVASSDLLERTPATGPVYMSDEAAKDRFSALADTPAGEASAPIEIASDDFLVAVKRTTVAEETAPFEVVSGDVKAYLLDEKRNAAQSKFFADLRDQAKVVILDPSLFPKPEQVKTTPASADVPAATSRPTAAPEGEKTAPASGDAPSSNQPAVSEPASSSPAADLPETASGDVKK